MVFSHEQIFMFSQEQIALKINDIKSETNKKKRQPFEPIVWYQSFRWDMTPSEIDEELFEQMRGDQQQILAQADQIQEADDFTFA